MITFKEMKILAIDYGTKMIGLSIGESEVKIPKQITPIHNYSNEDTIQKIKKIIEKEKINLALLGIPKVREPKKSWIYKKIFNFGFVLLKNLKIPLIFFDETDTSKEAKKRYNKRGYNVHSASSFILLERFLKLK